MTFQIEVKNGHWTVNGKGFNELSTFEKTTLNNFFQEIKYNGNTPRNRTNSRVARRNSNNTSTQK